MFIDTPVKRYSSGMYVRLGFSIAAHLQPDILLLDEVIAVGDAEFQAKCYERIRALRDRGTTVVFISHDLSAVESLCDRAVLLFAGEIAADGLTSDVINQYEQMVYGTAVRRRSQNRTVGVQKPIQITGLTFRDSEQREVPYACTGDPLVAHVEFAASEPLRDLDFEVFYYSPDGRLQCQFSTAVGDPLDLDRGAGAVQFSCAELGLLPGLYYADATIKRRTEGEQIDWQYRLALLRVEPGKRVSGRFYAPHKWQLKQTTDVVRTQNAFVNSHSSLVE